LFSYIFQLNIITLSKKVNISIWKKYILPPPTFTKVRFSSINSKTEQTTFLNFLNRAFYLYGAVLKAMLLQRMVVLLPLLLVYNFCYEGFVFVFFIYSIEYLKNHSKL